MTAQAFSIGSLSGTGGTVDLGGALNTLTVNQTADDTFAGAVTGSGTLVKDGSAKLTLTQDISLHRQHGRQSRRSWMLKA